MKRLLVLMAAVLLITPIKARAETHFDNQIIENEAKITVAVAEISERYGVDRYLIISIIEKESKGMPDIRGGECIGLMQLNPYYFRERMEAHGVDDITDIYGNILLGTEFIKELLDKYGDTHKALMVYNCGPDRAEELFRQGITQSGYSRLITQRAAELAAESEAKMAMFRECPHCGAHLDPGERCDCNEERKAVKPFRSGRSGYSLGTETLAKPKKRKKPVNE